MKLTKASVAKLALPSDREEAFFYDDDLPGFGLRVRATKRTWFVSYRLGGRGSPQRRLTIGPLENFDPDAARKAAREMLAKVRLGADPSQEKAERREQATATLGAAVEQYLEIAERKLKPRSYEEVKRHLQSHWKPLHGLPLAKVARQHVAAQLTRIAKESGPFASNRARAALSALYAWALGEGLADANPVVGTNKATEEISRDRVLSANELRVIWLEAGAGDYGAIIKLLMLTGQRREEVAALRWAEIDFKTALWTLPKERAKNGRVHDVPLSAAALAILKGLPKREGRELVFGEGKGPFSGWSNCKTRLDARVLVRLKRDDPNATLPDWRIHDLRRTAATGMVDLGVQPHVVEAVLNHVSGHKAGVAGVYNRATYAAEKRAALNLWARHILALGVQMDEPDDPLFTAGFEAAVDLSNKEAELHGEPDAVRRGQLEKELRTAGHKITPGAKAAALERNRDFKNAARAQAQAGETNLTRIARHALEKAREREQEKAENYGFYEKWSELTGEPAPQPRNTRIPQEKTQRRLVKSLGLSGKPGHPKH